MKEYCKEKVKNLAALRSNLFTCVIVLTGGLFSLFFMGLPFVRVLPLAVVGGYFDFIFLLNLLSINNEIDIILEELK